VVVLAGGAAQIRAAELSDATIAHTATRICRDFIIYLSFGETVSWPLRPASIFL
jgi:hypothetical protein